MALNDKMASLADGFRSIYQTSDKYSIEDMTKLLSKLEIHNLMNVMPTMTDGKANSEQNGVSQQFTDAQLNGQSFYPKVDIIIPVSKGDTVKQSLTIKTDGGIHDLTFNLGFNEDAPIGAEVSKIGENTYTISVKHAMTEDGNLRLMRFWALRLSQSSYIEMYNPYVAINSTAG